ncbi:hypothetical protein F5X96DRAFT_397867 [Biscogniauxia mediterranea]|nr:hypothetical protein F5X96DRAFT_397867 [Biscogniauxia mediterranea]
MMMSCCVWVWVVCETRSKIEYAGKNKTTPKKQVFDLFFDFEFLSRVLFADCVSCFIHDGTYTDTFSSPSPCSLTRQISRILVALSRSSYHRLCSSGWGGGGLYEFWEGVLFSQSFLSLHFIR